jgi:hypothetical protein
MLNKLSQDIAECYGHAGHCADKAKSVRDAGLWQEFLDMERRWLFLARSYEFAKQLETLDDGQGSAECHLQHEWIDCHG